MDVERNVQSTSESVGMSGPSQSRPFAAESPPATW